jgi:hypothetical protein
MGDLVMRSKKPSLKEQISEHLIRYLIIFAIGALGAVLLAPWLMNRCWPELGQIGDYTGGVLGTVFAFFTVVAMLFTILEQRKELKASRQIVSTQQFEATLFSLLEQLNRIKEKLDRQINTSDPTIEKFQYLLASYPRATVLSSIKNGVFSGRDLSTENFQSRLLKRNERIGQYFIYLYQILKYIYTYRSFWQDKERPLSPDGLGDLKTLGITYGDNEKRYANLVRACMDADALHILAVNCCCLPNAGESKLQFKQFKTLLEFYEFFEHMPPLGKPFFSTTADEEQWKKDFTDICEAYNSEVWGYSDWVEDILPESSPKLNEVKTRKSNKTTPVSRGD